MASKGQLRWGKEGRQVQGGKRKISHVYHFNEVSRLPYCSAVLLLLLTLPWRHGVILTEEGMTQGRFCCDCRWAQPVMVEIRNSFGNITWGVEGPEMNYRGQVMWFSSIFPQIKDCLGVINKHETESIFSIYSSMFTLCPGLSCYLFSLLQPPFSFSIHFSGPFSVLK